MKTRGIGSQAESGWAMSLGDETIVSFICRNLD